MAKTGCKHRWNLPCSAETVVLANCLDCDAKQYQSNDGMAGLKQANELNKKYGFPLIEFNRKKEKESVVIKEKDTGIGKTAQINPKMKELEKQKDAILIDYKNPDMPVKKMLTKYHMTTLTWAELKKLWNVPSKGRHPHNKSDRTEKASTPKPEKQIQINTIPADQVQQMLSNIEKRLISIDQGVSDLLNRGYIDEAMKAEITEAAIEYYSSITVCPRELRGKKILAIVQAIEGV